MRGFFSKREILKYGRPKRSIDSLLDRDKLAVSFSGGRSSAVMTKMIWDLVGDKREVSITFANTGCEHEATLKFIHDCERKFGWPVVWLEAVVSEKKGVGIRHKVVDFETASRNGEPFESVVHKYGIFNQTNPACTDRLKVAVMKSYLQEKGFIFGKQVNHDTAIGIRADEADRMSSKRREQRLIYPLVVAGITKRDVGIEIKKWGFDLEIPHDAYGNCTWCWKKSLRKHLTLAKESPDVFDFPKRMEENYSHVGGGAAAHEDGKRYWFRKHMSTDDIIKMANETEFSPYVDDYWDHAKDFDDELDRGGSCGDGCDIGVDE